MPGPSAVKSANGFFRCDTWLQIFQNDSKICEAEVTVTPLINKICNPWYRSLNIILYNCCIPRYYFTRILYGSELYHIDNNSKKWHLSSSCIRSYRILFGFLHNVAEKLECFCQKIVVWLHRLLHSSENGQQKHCWHSQFTRFRNQWLWLTESTFLTLSAYYLCGSTRQYKAF